MATTTESYQLKLPFILASVSPDLAALHALRARLLRPTDAALNALHCPRCGVLLVDGCGETRLTRSYRNREDPGNNKNAASFRRLLRRSCKRCGYRGAAHVESDSPLSFPPPRRQGHKGVAEKKARHDSEQAPNTVNPYSTSRERCVAPLTVAPSPVPITDESVHAVLPSALSPSTSSVRPKRRSKNFDLQEMLVRSRKRQEEAKELRSHQLSTLLQELT
ncbi:hypothetical protein BKA93DRAFT_280202 [Sparassis latifolia]|uniref:Rpr2-domain-containing protein n=1 Tax=Sparassis crispa TaxID=139825 RepID=A0A401GC53_9APHY|nr:hypothetical protein SCP_0209260 [Sparassis crispa]GBE79725.1 hypothetical protein SCP_0209260 [Sparassis crispa]